jgi:exodeoxyribonuclease VII large subunit
LGERRERLRWLAGRAAQVSPVARFGQQAQRLDELDQRMVQAMRRSLQGRRERLLWLRGRSAQVSPSARLTQLLSRLEELEQRVGRAMRQVHIGRETALLERRNRLWRANPSAAVRALAARRDALAARLEAAARAGLRDARERLSPLARTLHAVSPQATLERGYAIVVDERGKILRDAAEAADGETIEARLAVGRIRARVQRP